METYIFNGNTQHTHTQPQNLENWNYYSSPLLRTSHLPNTVYITGCDSLISLIYSTNITQDLLCSRY